MLKQAVRLWRGERKGSTLQRRLVLFFALVVVCVILCFTLLLFVFGITGSGRQAVEQYLESELTHCSQAVGNDFGNLSVTGIALAQSLSGQSDRFLAEHGLTAGELAEHPDYIEPLLSRHMPDLLAASDNNACGGVFVVLDTSIQADAGKERMAGVFIKKTQPVSSASLAAKEYWLRGPAPVAREYGIELLGQWQMEYDAGELPFFTSVMETARANPDASLSRLYYWSGRVCLNGNSEEGMLLCVPLRGGDGTVYGMCGIEVSDRMFKSLYSPNESEWSGVFTIAAPISGSTLYGGEGLLAGNSYLTGRQLSGELAADGAERGFPCFAGERGSYAGLYEEVRLYPTGSPYEGERWAVAVLMPRASLSDAARGSSVYLYLIVGGLLVVSLVACVFISRKYLRPIHRGLSSIRDKSYGGDTSDIGILEIDDLFDFLAQKDREHGEQLERLDKEKQDVKAHYDRAQEWITRLAGERMPEVDPDGYTVFLQCLHTLTTKEREVFELYLEGKTTKEIMELASINQNTLKYHNRNIYSKLGVTSRKQLLEYAALMKHQKGEDGP